MDKGEFVGWNCRECEANESFYYGIGTSLLNDDDFARMCDDGDYGPATRALLGDGVPEGWTVNEENAFYTCPKCGDVIQGSAIRIDDGSGSMLVAYADVPACGSCGEKPVFLEDMVPMSFAELTDRCKAISESKCPKCGADAVEMDMGNWD